MDDNNSKALPIELLLVEVMKSNEKLSKSNEELKTLNLRVKEDVDISKKRLDLLEMPWWKRLFGMTPAHWS